MPSWKDDPHRFEPRPESDGHLLILLNGILTRPGDQFAWTDRAEYWFTKRTGHDVDSYEYWQTPILGRLLDEHRHIRECIELLAGYWSTWPKPPVLHLVGHSRGCEIARQLVVTYGVKVQSLHLFAPAVDSDFEANGLNAALRANRVNRIRLYTSKGDWVLRWFAGISCGLYGRLGYTGPKNVARDVAHRVEIVERNQFGHGDWFTAEHFRDSMNLVEWEIDNLPMR